MYRKIKIDGKEIELVANAATPFRYKQTFGKDLLAILGNEAKAETQGVDTITELAFIMNKQAEKADMNKLNNEVFFEWLEDFGSMAFINSAEDVLNVYMDSATSTSTP